MKKVVLPIIFILFLLPLLSSIDLTVEKEDLIQPIIKELGLPATFTLNITNNGATDTFEIYNLVGLIMEPEKITLEKDETKEITLQITSIEEFPAIGNYNLHYFIQATDDTEIRENFTLKVVTLNEAFEVGAGDLDIETSVLSIYIQNEEMFHFPEVNATFTSPFFTLSETFSLSPNERKSFDISLDRDDFKKLSGGFYTLFTTITVAGIEEKIEGIINFIEEDLLKKDKKTTGFIIRTYVETNENLGNTKIESITTLKKDIISRLFTTFSPKPDAVQREGAKVFYTWSKDINPGETFTVKARTNWIFPIIIIALVVFIVAFVKQYTRTNLILKKRISFVKAKGGEFGLKITLQVHAQKFVGCVRIIDRVPFLAKLYNKFSGLYPSHIDTKNRKIEWEIPSLEQGEKRIFSYMIYSKIGVLGKFALPKAKAFFEKEGEPHEVGSNRAFFIAEQKRKDPEMDF